MGRFIYKPGAIYENNENFLEIWKDSGPLELYKDDEDRLMTFDHFKIPINRTYYLEKTREKLHKNMIDLFTPNGIDKAGNYGDILQTHKYYNYIEDRILGKYLYDYENGRFKFEDTEHSITPIEEELYKLRDHITFIISRLDYITSVMRYNLYHIEQLLNKYQNVINGRIIENSKEIVDNLNHNDTHKTLRDTILEVDKLDLLITNIDSTVSNRIANLDKYLGKNASIFYAIVGEYGVVYDNKPYDWLIISTKPMYASEYKHNENIIYKYEDVAYINKGEKLPQLYTLTNVPDKGPLTYVFSNSEMFYKSGDEYIAKEEGTCYIFAVCYEYNNIKSNVITVHIGGE